MPHPIITRLRAATLACAALVLAACSDSTTPPVAAVNAPQEFAFSLSAGEAWSYTDVKLEGAYVVITSRGQGRQPRNLRTVPTETEWTAFWAAVDAAGVQRWTGDYNAEGYVDGLGWSLRLAGPGVSIDTHGNNAYPDRDGREQHLYHTTEFTAFVNALGELTGWEFFAE